MVAQAKVKKKNPLRWFLRELLGNLTLIAILFAIVNRWDWWNGWALSAIYILWSIGTIVFILPVNPDLLAERSRPATGSKKWDFVLVYLMGLFQIVSYVIACLDIRLTWAAPFSLSLQIVGVIVAFISYDVLLLWSMVVNAYFTAIIRIQIDRQHHVVTRGPYRFVRHPGYLGTIIFHLSVPFILGSRWSLIPAVLAAVILIIRTALEDKTLRSELPGYSDYVKQTRYRLFPWIW